MTDVPPPPAPDYPNQPAAASANPYSTPQANPYASSTPYAAAPQQRTNVLAIIALIAAFVVPLAGIICGHIALSQIKRTGENGRGLALAGTVLGYIFTVLGLLFIIAYFAFFAWAASQSGVSYY